MQCKECGYRLWNIQSRTCPECGKDFKPSEFDYVPSSVAFCCPHCDQSYFGTDERGHLTPRAFECVGCKRHIDMDEMVLRPGPGYEERQAHQSENPWVERKKSQSSFLAWIKTSWRAMMRPNDLAKTFGDRNDCFPASISFLFFNNALITLLGLGVIIVMVGMETLTDSYRNNHLETAAGLVALLGLCAMGGAFAAFIVVSIWAMLTHGALRVLAKPEGNFRETFDCLCFSNGVTFITAVPICGLYGLSWIVGIWWPISAGFMLAKRHKVSVGRAMMAAWVFPIIAVIGLGGLIGYMVHTVQKQISNMATEMVSTKDVGQAILKQVHDDNTIGPDHVLRLLLSDELGGIWEWQLADNSPTNWGSGFQEGCNNISRVFDVQSSDDSVAVYKKHITDALDQLPPLEGPGYRFGSVLFLYNKVTTDKLDPQLWLMVVWPRASQPQTVQVFFADGRTRRFDVTKLIDAVDEQDALRRKLELPEIGSLDAINIRPIPLLLSQTNMMMDFEHYDLSKALLAVTQDDGNIGPRHVLELLLSRKVATALFDDADKDDWNSFNTNNNGMGNWHDQWIYQARKQQKQALKQTLASLPPRQGPGYRFGQMVMVYDGIAKDKLDDRLWLAVRWPRNYAPEQTRIFLADGRMIHVLARDIPRLLVEQDQLRSELGLPRIEDLSRIPEVTLSIPDVGGGSANVQGGFNMPVPVGSHAEAEDSSDAHGDASSNQDE
ncbi:MAG: hypothetical protein CMJ19_17125 [Phycisphaeraceae bacterium]|nr:hypothetical protein [Phycisphaeraceae bacterium]